MFSENLHCWPEFYTTTGRTGRAKYQLWLRIKTVDENICNMEIGFIVKTALVDRFVISRSQSGTITRKWATSLATFINKTGFSHSLPLSDWPSGEVNFQIWLELAFWNHPVSTSFSASQRSGLFLWQIKIFEDLWNRLDKNDHKIINIIAPTPKLVKYIRNKHVTPLLSHFFAEVSRLVSSHSNAQFARMLDFANSTLACCYIVVLLW